MATLTFHGAAGTVTGSKYLLEARGERLLLDCGLFQGLKALRELNWKAPAFEARPLRWVVLTHAHVDHSGWLPRLYKAGFRGRIFSTPATAELVDLLLMDSARLQEEDARFLNKKGATKHSPALPLYDEDDARQVLRHLEIVPYERWKKLSAHLAFRFINVGHLLGSAMVEVRITGDEEGDEIGDPREAVGDLPETTPSVVASVSAHAAPFVREGEAGQALTRADASVMTAHPTIASGRTIEDPQVEALKTAPAPEPGAGQAREAARASVTAAAAPAAVGVWGGGGAGAPAQGGALAEPDLAEKGAPDLLLARRPRSLTVLFSGDVGRYAAPLAPDPDPPVPCDVLVIESTYGDRPHPEDDLHEELAKIAETTFARRGVLLVPAFAVGRSQQIIFMLRELYERGRLRRVPIHVDSPMAVDATEIYSRHPGELDPLKAEKTGGGFLAGPDVTFHRSQTESRRLNSFEGPGVIISSSGMLTGGRILHHLAQRMTDPRNTILLVGFQAAGTRGRALVEGATYLRFHGEEVQVRAEVRQLHGLSGHADAIELLRWTAHLEAPRQVFVTHGEPEAAEALAETLRRERGWRVTVPELHQRFRF